MNVVWSPLAIQKLGDAAEFISLDNPSAAEKWVNKLCGHLPKSLYISGSKLPA